MPPLREGDVVWIWARDRQIAIEPVKARIKGPRGSRLVVDSSVEIDPDTGGVPAISQRTGRRDGEGEEGRRITLWLHDLSPDFTGPPRAHRCSITRTRAGALGAIARCLARQADRDRERAQRSKKAEIAARRRAGHKRRRT